MQIYLARVKGRFPGNLSHMQELSLDSIDLQGYLLGDDDGEHTNSSTNHRKRPRAEDTVTNCSDNSISTNVQDSSSSTSTSIAAASSGSSAPPVGYYKGTVEAFRSLGINLDINLHSSTDRSVYDNTVYAVSVPIAVLSHRDGLHTCDITASNTNSKHSLSVFLPVAYNPSSDTSLVVCTPYTGRTHQLRLHLQHAGNPIANDPCYGGELYFGNAARRKAAVDALVAMRRKGIMPIGNPHYVMSAGELEEELKKAGEEDTTSSTNSASDNTNTIAEEDLAQREGESDDDYLVRTCRYCRHHNIPTSSGTSGTFENPEQLLHCDGIWLHALKYGGSDWSFATDLPHWASEMLETGCGDSNSDRNSSNSCSNSDNCGDLAR
jgi:hypothetical protein